MALTTAAGISPLDPPEVQALKRRLGGAAVGVLVGVATSVTLDATFGGVITVGAYALLVTQLHRFGRAGPA
ncbi:MAG: hypothetical protein FJ104_14220 [Deltaproteobacteria bacterium]|nr:hypothetical protein [Deltaproteobacteria bacterium]